MIVVIPTYQRIEITTINIKLLLAQKFIVVLVVSDRHELEYYSQFRIFIILSPNKPLGFKWQQGINYARSLSPDHVVILGSDDLLSKDFREKYKSVTTFTGFKTFYAYSARLYQFEYLPEQPIGGGRIYPKEYLDAIDWEVFDSSKDRLLDDKGFYSIKKWNYQIINETEVLAIKGRWPVLNPLNIRHKNINLMGSWEGGQAKKLMKEKFNYDPSGGAQITDRALS